MQVFAACAASYEESVRRAAGVSPVLSPPLEMDNLSPGIWSGYDFYYFKLHGLPGQPFWYGDDWVSAVSAAQLRQVDMTGAVVFAAGCNLFSGDPPEGPMLSALWSAGASAVIGGEGENFGARRGVVGADALGINVRRLVLWGANAKMAYELALLRLSVLVPWREAADERKAREDALGFRLLLREECWGE